VTDETGSGALVFATSPSLTTPTLGVATATSVNKWAFTAPTTAATLTAGGDSLTYTMPVVTCNIPSEHCQQLSKSTNYTLVLADAGAHVYHPSSDNNARTFTIPANSSVAFPIGTCVAFVNEINTVSIAITTDTLTDTSGNTGTRTLAANGIAVALKVASTKWVISGKGLS
jgi:hypothetical protein